MPKRLVPIFRDREELPAANDLSAEVRAALRASRSLIVVCSPAAAASTWVEREVEVFRQLHPDRPVLAAMRYGEPADCFPSSLRQTGKAGVLSEPLAADFRRGRDTEHLGLLKLVAGILRLGLDELVQRDAHRRAQRVTAVTASALAAMIVMGVLTVFALNARSEAERQRGEAEGLVEYMLTDLRDRLKGVGRLDVMTAVNERALRYYSDQDLAMLQAASLERRARIFHAMGEDDETRGKHDVALAEFLEARRTTAALLAEAPNDPERLYDHAQSEYWIGAVAYDLGKYARAKRSMLAYKSLVVRALSVAHRNSKYQLELGEANSNLCAVTVTGHMDSRAAVRYCTDALSQTETATRGRPISGDRASNLIDRHAWLADAYRAAGQIDRAKAERFAEERILNAQIAGDPNNMDLKDTWIALQRALAQIDMLQGDKAVARERLAHALATADDMTKFDPTNKQWAGLRSVLRKEAAGLHTPREKETTQ